MMNRIFAFLFLAVLVAGCGGPSESFDESVANGQAALRAGDWSAAERSLRGAVRADPENGRLQYNYGQAAFRAGKLSRAGEAFSRAAALLRGDEATDALLGLVRVRGEQGRWRAVQDAMDRANASASLPRKPDVLAVRAAVNMRQGLVEPARADLYEALTINPDHPAALYNLGCVFLAGGDKAAAGEAFNRFFQVAGPGDAEAMKKFEDRMDEVIDVLPGASRRALDYIQRSNETVSPTEARNLALQAVKEDPIGADALWNYAVKLALAQENAEAKAAYLRFAALHPQDPRVAQIPQGAGVAARLAGLESGRKALAARNWKGAETAFRSVTGVDPACFEAVSGLTTSLIYQSRHAEALQEARRAAALRPYDADVLYNVGSLSVAVGQIDEAAAAFRRYLQFADVAANPERAQSVRKWLADAEKNGGSL